MDWSKMEEEVDRTGLERQSYTILGINLPHVIIPVRPGRDIARLIQVAALDQKLKSLGHNAAREFNERLIERMHTAR
jgi:HPr kinase/phosphorylase